MSSWNNILTRLQAEESPLDSLRAQAVSDLSISRSKCDLLLLRLAARLRRFECFYS